MIEVDGLSKRAAGGMVLRDVSLRVEAGEVAALIGPSGGGKTTLLRCLNGLATWDEGALTVDGIRVGADASTRARDEAFGLIRRRMGMVFQDYQLFPHQTVLANVAAGPWHVLRLGRDEAQARARRLLDRVGLLDKADAHPEQLSGGQQQRVAIARALALEPRALLFDEPTSALDPGLTGAVAALLRELAADGLALVVVTHTLALARAVAGTLHVLDHGRIVESGPTARVLDAPGHPTTRALVAP